MHVIASKVSPEGGAAGIDVDQRLRGNACHVEKQATLAHGAFPQLPCRPGRLAARRTEMPAAAHDRRKMASGLAYDRL